MSTRRARKSQGSVALVGAGPGDAGLLTLRAAAVLAVADLVLHDEGVAPGVLAYVREGAQVLPAPTAADAAALLVAASREGGHGVLLVGGDPFAGGIAATVGTAVAKARQALEVVPGVPPAVGVPAYAGVPVGMPRTVADVTPEGDPTGTAWSALAAAPGTLVLRAPLAALGKAAAALAEHGRAGDTLVSVTVGGTTTRQRTVVSTLDHVEAALTGLALPRERTPDPSTVAVVVVGDAVRRRDRLSWWEERPLFGWSVLVPRTREQGSSLSGLLRGLGADPLEVPTIAVEPPRTPAPMERAVRGLVSGRYAWVAFTSANAVRAVREKLEESGLDARAFAGVRLAAVGDATAAALAAYGLRADLVPTTNQSSEGLLEQWPDRDEQLDVLDRVLLPRADIATETLAAGLKQRGWTIDDITAYRTVRAAPPPAPVREALKTGRIDAVLFTSSSTVRNLVGIAGKPHESTVVGCIGPATCAAAEELGLRVDVRAATASVESLAEALAEFAVARRAEQRAAAAQAAAAPAPAASSASSAPAASPARARVRPSRARARQQP